jgi:transaldolase
MTDPLARLESEGVSIWLDDLSRELVAGGELADLVRDRHVVGVTSNPTIFSAALGDGSRYYRQLNDLATAGADVDSAVFDLTTDDVRSACDLLEPVHQRTDGVDGRVSIEVDPGLAHDTTATLDAARRLWRTVDRPNAMIKIPATVEGLPAVASALAEGISVNVTLIFSVQRYRSVMGAFLTGMERAAEAGHDLSRISSVASFFVSRLDTEVDARLAALGPTAGSTARGRAAVANARLAYQAHEEVFARERWSNLAGAGARPQRPLWASTGVKNPDYSDTMYVTDLVAPGTVNTMPRTTLEAVADHGRISGDTIRANYSRAHAVMEELAALGIDYTDVTDTLEQQGLDKFDVSWAELLSTVSDALARVSGTDSQEESQQ